MAIGHRTPKGPPVSPHDHVIELASPEWCWSQLRRRTEGILSHRSPHGPASTPVRFTLTDQQATLLVPRDAVGLSVGAEVTLALGGEDAEGLRWVVRATGTALLAAGSTYGDSRAASRRRHPAYSAVAYPDDVLRLPVSRVRGFYETAPETGDVALPAGDTELTAGG